MFFSNLKAKSLAQSFEELSKQNEAASQTLAELNEKIAKAKEELSFYTNASSGWIEMEEIGLEHYPVYESSTELEQKIQWHETTIASMMNNEFATVPVIIYTRTYKIDGSEAKGRKFQTNYGKNLLQGFNAYYNTKSKSLSCSNLGRNMELVINCFNRFNKQADLLGISLNEQYLKELIEIMRLKALIKYAKDQEKAKIKEEKRRLKEQEKLLEEAEKAKKKLAEERKQYEQALARSISEEEQTKIREKLATIDKREADIDYRITQQKAGWLYVISSKSLPNICKLGCTRRLNPFERIKELSSASLPYPYVCKGLVFSEDVFALENAIHNRFDAQRVNKENLHKEHFYITPQEAIDVLQEEFNCEVKFIDEGEFEE